MRQFWIVAAAVALVVVPGSVGWTGDAARQAEPVELTGYITDEWCGAANANPRGAGCARACAKKGSDLAIYAGGKLYKLSDKKQALEHLGYEVTVVGTLDESGVLEVASIRKADRPKGDS